MSWFKLDDGFAHHPKVTQAGNAPTGLFVRCGTYCARYETDGRVSFQIARELGSRREIDALLESGLWVENGSGFLMPDYLEYNPSKAEQHAKRTADRDRKRRQPRDDSGRYA